MRMIVLAFALVAATKVWTQDRMYRSVMSDALVQAYRERAQQVCLKDTVKPAKSTALPWTASATAEIVIGSPNAAVALWDYNNPMWDVRYRHPHLVLTAIGNAKMSCAYDLAVGVATLSQR
jgi:hypothetical protein